MGTRLADRHEVTQLTYHKRCATPASQRAPGARVIEWQESALKKAERLKGSINGTEAPFPDLDGLPS